MATTKPPRQAERCRQPGCDARIRWGKLPPKGDQNERRIPLNYTRVRIYDIDPDGNAVAMLDHYGKVVLQYVSHWLSCKNPPKGD